VKTRRIPLTTLLVLISLCSCSAKRSGPPNTQPRSGTAYVAVELLDQLHSAAAGYYAEHNEWNGYVSSSTLRQAGVSIRFEAPAKPGAVSLAMLPGGDGVVMESYASATRDCLGVLYITRPLQHPVLGKQLPGVYLLGAEPIGASECASRHPVADKVDTGTFPIGS
jgi:hypothetical protein